LRSTYLSVSVLGRSSPHLHMPTTPVFVPHHSHTTRIVSSAMFLRLGSARVEINPWNPLYAFAPLILFLVSIPLTVFAIITTSMAVAVLCCRGLVVYFNLGTALLTVWLSPPSKSPTMDQQPLLPPPSPEKPSPLRHRNRRSSNTSNESSQDTAIVGSHIPHKSGSFTTLSCNNDMTRDYEGVGGWRDPGDENEEALWMSINGRLELPAGPPVRRHRRSLTGGASPHSRRKGSSEAIRMSPLQTRVRTPMKHTDERYGNGEYFPPQPASNSVSDPSKRHQRRRSGSASSTSSAASGIMMAVKVAGE
jgi:hypothetical protein